MFSTIVIVNFNSKFKKKIAFYRWVNKGLASISLTQQREWGMVDR